MDQRTCARFASKINQHGPVPEHRPDLGPCWLWLGAPGDNGYGYFWLDGKKRLAHRVSYEHHVEAIPEGLTIDHLCRTTICVRPDHLEPVSAAVNIFRGTGPAARNVAATHCFRGHPFDEENTYIYPNGDRGCRECQRVRVKEWREKNDPPSGAGKGWKKQITECPQGHPYDEVNTYWKPSGGRQCRECMRTANREAQRRRRAAARQT